MAGKESKIAVIVGSVTDDIRLDGHDFPALKVAALRFTEGARARITKAGGECLTFDQLALLRPKGENTVLLRGRRNARVATRYFGTPGASNSTTRPKVESKGRKVRLVAARLSSRGCRSAHGAMAPSSSVAAATYHNWSASHLLTSRAHQRSPASCSLKRHAAAVSPVASRSRRGGRPSAWGGAWAWPSG